MKHYMVIAASALVIASCGGNEVAFTPTTTEATTTTTTTTTTTEAPKPVETRPTLPPTTAPKSTYDPDGFISALMYGTDDLYWLVADSDLLDLGLAVCMDFDSGMSLDDELYSLTLGLIAENAGYLAEDIGYMVGSAIAYLCPEYLYLLDNL